MKIRNVILTWCIVVLTTILPTGALAQKVQGLVIDASTGEALIGASVLVKGAPTGTVTDYEGHFTIELSKRATLTVSYVGYLSKDVTASPGTTINV